MDAATALALIVTTVALAAIPGPNVALIVGNTLTHGIRHGIATAFGTMLGVGAQALMVIAGLTLRLEAAAAIFPILRWAGVAWLFYLSIAAWRQGREALREVVPPKRRPLQLVQQGLLMALVNPKTLLFNAAFLPQFWGPETGAIGLVEVAVLYLVMLFGIDVLWSLAAEKARGWMKKGGALRHRLSAGMYAAAGIGLALARDPR